MKTNFDKKRPLQKLFHPIVFYGSGNLEKDWYGVMKEDGDKHGHNEQGGFQLLDLIITELKSHMTC